MYDSYSLADVSSLPRILFMSTKGEEFLNLNLSNLISSGSTILSHSSYWCLEISPDSPSGFYCSFSTLSFTSLFVREFTPFYFLSKICFLWLVLLWYAPRMFHTYFGSFRIYFGWYAPTAGFLFFPSCPRILCSRLRDLLKGSESFEDFFLIWNRAASVLAAPSSPWSGVYYSSSWV